MELSLSNAQRRFNLIIQKTWIAGLALALATASPALAGRHTSTHSTSSWEEDEGGGDNSFSVGTLNGTYVFEASGFADDGKVGEVSVLGTLTFDGAGGVPNGNLIVTHGNSVQSSCSDTFDIGGAGGFPTGNGSYTFNNPGVSPGLFSMVLPLVPNPAATPPVVNSGSLNFGILVPNADGGHGQVIETDNGSLSGVSICGTAITSMDLKGSLKALGDGGGD
jgi:hypothetical protein